MAGALLLAGTVPTLADEQMLLAGRFLCRLSRGFRLRPVCLVRASARSTSASLTRRLISMSFRIAPTPAVDFFDASDDTYIGRVGGFAGVKCNTATPPAANNSISGPDGVIIVGGNTVWAGDGDSTLKVIDIATFSITDTIQVIDPTDSSVKMRVDEMAWDARDHILAAANNANTPPFITLVNTDTHKILGQIIFDTAHAGVDAQNGIEQSQWSPQTGLFYVSIPQLGPDPAQGGVVGDRSEQHEGYRDLSGAELLTGRSCARPAS